MFKFTAAVIAALAIAVVLSGCGSGGPGDPPAGVTGSVVTIGVLENSDYSFDAPLEGVQVQVVGKTASVTTGADGSFNVTGLSNGNYTFRFTKTGYDQLDRTVSVTGGEKDLGMIRMVRTSPDTPDVPDLN